MLFCAGDYLLLRIIFKFLKKDNKITARELHAYVEKNVVQQSSGSQTPELKGDKD